MSNWRVQNAGNLETIGLVRSASRGTQLPSLSAGHTWSAYTELAAATAHSAEGFLVNAVNAAGSGNVVLVEIALGAAASERTIFGPWTMDGTPAVASEGQALFVPVRILAGSRVSARWRSIVVETGLYPPRLSLVLMGASPLLPVGASATTAYGVTIDASNTLPTEIDSGATANTVGAWVEVSASITRRLHGFYLCMGLPPSTGWRHPYLIDVGIGAGGSEIVLVTVSTVGDVSGQLAPHMAGPFLIPVPAGSRLAVRSQCTSTTAGDRNCGAYLLGLE